MTKLLGTRTVYDIDPNKTFRIADILESGAILPRSVLLSDLLISELTESADYFMEEDYEDDYQERSDLWIMGNGG